MKSIWAVLLFAVALGFAAPSADAESNLSLDDQAALQAAMQRHIDRVLVDGAVLYIDRESGEARQLHPVTAHPMILAYGEHFVLCFDFRDEDGKNVPIDYYMARQDRSYVVFHTAVADRTLLKELMGSGRVTRLK
ncbi:MAG: hypothetical protein P1U88_00815 [Thalassobaculaceae bacterium]|nr:hypothetical protein [Thalassobaculaceae bacterium]